MQIMDLQRELAEAGAYRGPIDGINGSRTISSVMSFQRAHGLKPDGIVGPATLALLPPIHPLAGLPANVSPNCVDLVKAFEGLGDGDPHTTALEFYWDVAGYASVGWGHLLYDADKQRIQRRSKDDAYAPVRARAAMLRYFGRTVISIEEAKALLSVDLNACLGRVSTYLQDIPTMTGELDALISFAFNVGSTALLNSTVYSLHKRRIGVGMPPDFFHLEVQSKTGVISTDMASALGAWSKAGGDWQLGLFRRRMAEALVYAGGAAVDAFQQVQAIA